MSILFRYTFVHIDMLESMLATRTACSLSPLPLLGELLGASWLAPIWQARPSLVRSMMRTFFFYFFIYISPLRVIDCLVDHSRTLAFG